MLFFTLLCFNLLTNLIQDHETDETLNKENNVSLRQRKVHAPCVISSREITVFPVNNAMSSAVRSSVPDLHNMQSTVCHSTIENRR